MRVLIVLALLAALAFAGKLVLTPSGYLPEECVFAAPHGAQVVDMKHLKETHVFDARDNLIAVLPACPVPLQKPEGRSTSSKRQNMPDGWTAYTMWDSPNTISSFIGNWPVPPVPDQQDSQTLFLFTGLQNGYTSSPPDGIAIIQPVLQFGGSAAGGGAYWAISSWYVGSSAVFSPLKQVKAGDNIYGSMVAAPNGAQTSWNITTTDTTAKITTSIVVQVVDPYPWAFVTLEVYSVAQCGDFPNGFTKFSNLNLGSGSTRLTPAWQVQTEDACDEAVNIPNPSTVIIQY